MNIIAGFFGQFSHKTAPPRSRRYSCYHSRKGQWLVKDNKKETVVAGPYQTYEEAKGKRNYLNDQDIRKRQRVKTLAKAALTGGGALLSGLTFNKTFRFGGKERPQPKMLTASVHSMVLDKGHEQVLFPELLGKSDKEKKYVE